MTSDQFTADVDDLEARLRNALDRHPAGKGLPAAKTKPAAAGGAGVFTHFRRANR